MPILERETSLWPERLLECPEEMSDSEWHVIHARPRTEKSLARRLHQRELPFYLPLHEQRRVYQRRRVSSFCPLFPGYLFVLSAEDRLTDWWYDREVVNVLKVSDQARIWNELASLRRVLEAGVPVTREERLQPGMRARIKTGPLQGLEGKVLARRNGLKFAIEVAFLQRGASVEIDSDSIEAL
jgi:transcriptional antiterminator RfaH